MGRGRANNEKYREVCTNVARKTLYLQVMNRTIVIFILTTMLSLLMCSCDSFSLYSEDKSTVIASMADQELRESALQDIYSPEMSSKDSAIAKSNYVEAWVMTQVKKEAALDRVQSGKIDQSQIDKMVEEYRTKLLIHSLEHSYISTHLDTVISDAQIEEYYDQNPNSFKLAGPLVKTIVVRMPEGLRQSKRLEDLFLKGDAEDVEDFLNICTKNGYKVVDNRENWRDFTTVLKDIPFNSADFDAFLKKNRRYEVTDSDYKYLMRIEEYLPTGAISPLEREKYTISKILRNLRRSDIIKQLNDSLHSTAMNSGSIVIEYQSKKDE